MAGLVAGSLVLAACTSDGGSETSTEATNGADAGTTAGQEGGTTGGQDSETTDGGTTQGGTTLEDPTADGTTVGDPTQGETTEGESTGTGEVNTCPDDVPFGTCGAFLPCEDDPEPLGPCPYEPLDVARCVAEAGAAGERFFVGWATSIQGSGQFEEGTTYAVLDDGRILENAYTHDDLTVCAGPFRLLDNASTASYETCAAAGDEEVVGCVQGLLTGLALVEQCGGEECQEK